MLGFHALGVNPLGTLEDIVTGNVILPSLVSAGFTVHNVGITPGTAPIATAVVTAVLDVPSPSLFQGSVISPTTVNVGVTIPLIGLLAGSSFIRPTAVSLSSQLDAVKVYDPLVGPRGYFFNETATEFFRQQTGQDSYQFNELAKAYYRQAASLDEEAFNELLIAAQDAAGFVGLAPTDWRNL